MTTTPQPQNTNQDNRPEPSILTNLLLDDDPDSRHTAESSRTLPIALLISLCAHLIILAIAACAARRDGHQAEPTIVQPNIQIRLQQSPPRTTAASNDQEQQSQPPTNSDVATDEAIPPSETETAEPDTTTESIALAPTPVEELATPATPPPIQAPSLTDLRTAARNRAEQEHQSRSTHPDCLVRERRSAFLDCDEADYDYVSAERNDTYVFFTPALPDQPQNDTSEQTSTNARIKAALDMFDNQLGTTQVKRRLMNVQ